MKLSKMFRIGLILAVLPAAVTWAGGAQEGEPPTLELPPQPRQYISPENDDGVNDELTLPFESVVVPSEDIVIVEYELTIFNADGREVFTVSERQEDTRGFFGNVFGGERPQVAIPDSLTWDGTWMVAEDRLPSGVSNGELVEDGEYTYQLTIIDENGNFSRSAPFNVTVDNQPPRIGEFREPAYTVFSPNGDGNRDTITMPFSGSRELRWVVSVLNENDEVVYSAEYENETPRRLEEDPAPPSEFVWDGSTGTADDPAERAPEGTYRFRLTGTDRAGNEASALHPTAIELSLQGADLMLGTADGINRFSPNDDGRRDTIVLQLASNAEELIRTWTVEILNGDRVVRSISGRGELRDSWEFDGRRDDGSLLGDGRIQAVLSAVLENGNTVSSAPLTLVIDTMAPQASLSADTAPQETEAGRPIVFGAGEKSRLTATVTYDADVEWTFRLSHDGNEVVSGSVEEALDQYGIQPQTVEGGDRLRVGLEWSGEALVGTGSAQRGTYSLILSAQDIAGNQTETAPARVTYDDRTPEIALTQEGQYLSPLSSGAYQNVTFRTEYGAPEIISEFLFEIRNADDEVVRSSYQRSPFERFDWNGLTNGGTVVPDGRYTASLRVIYQNGHIAESDEVGPAVVDQTPPRIERLTAEPRIFSPDDDGENDRVTIQQSTVPGDDWTGRIVNEQDEVVFEREWDGEVEPFEWDGTDSAGRTVPDGNYTYVLTSTDEAGNSTREELVVTVDTEPAGPPEIDLSLRPQPFSPDGDGRDDRLTIDIDLRSEREIVSWEVVIEDFEGETFKTWSGDGRPPQSLRWDGVSDEGELVETARDYPIRLTVIDGSGEETSAEDVIAVDILVMREGNRLRIRVSNILFAPNTPDLFLSDRQQLEENLSTLQRLAEVLNRYPEHDIIIEGHAAHIFLEDPARQQEQEQTLIPLSRARATEVMQALMILGVDGDRMTIEAYGGSRPVVPHSNRGEMWRNRRVEFLLQREGR